MYGYDPNDPNQGNGQSNLPDANTGDGSNNGSGFDNGLGSGNQPSNTEFQVNHAATDIVLGNTDPGAGGNPPPEVAPPQNKDLYGRPPLGGVEDTNPPLGGADTNSAAASTNAARAFGQSLAAPPPAAEPLSNPLPPGGTGVVPASGADVANAANIGSGNAAFTKPPDASLSPLLNSDATYKNPADAAKAGFSTPPGPAALDLPTMAGAPAPTGQGGNGTLSNQDWQNTFQKDFGFYDPRFNSRDNLLANAQQGDQQIMGQLAEMAKTDADAARVLHAIESANGGNLNSTGNFYNSQNAVNWDTAHNAQVQSRLAAGDYTGKTGATALSNEQVRVPLSAIPNATAFPDQAKLVDGLTQLGAKNATINPYGGVTWTGTDGQQYGIGHGPNGQPLQNVSLADVHGALATVSQELAQQHAAAAQQQTAAAAPPPQQQQGNSYAPRSVAAPRSSGYGQGGGYGAPAPAAPQYATPQESYNALAGNVPQSYYPPTIPGSNSADPSNVGRPFGGPNGNGSLSPDGNYPMTPPERLTPAGYVTNRGGPY